MDIDKKERFREIINNAKHAVFFGGAGVSTASGIPDFRSADGIFVKGGVLNPEEVVSDRFFFRYPDDFYAFYKEKMLFPHIKPNAAHVKLAEWEQEGKIKAVITQNIDGLHQKAGSKNVIELHGSSLRNYCLNCYKRFDLDYVYNYKGTPKCDNCGGLIKPDVVLYGESLDSEVLSRADYEIKHADVLIVGGTSLAVYPAAAFVYNFSGEHLIVVNNSPTGADESAELVFREDIASLFASL